MKSPALFALTLLVLVSAGCNSNSDFGTFCAISQTFIESNCKSKDNPQAKLTCVTESHPSCNNRVCLIYQESEPFCTLRCNSSNDCPGKAPCKETIFQDGTGAYKKFCVPSKLAN